MPVGPVETQQSWYAGSRLGIYCCTVLLWGSGSSTGSPEIHFYIGRVKEKGAAYSMSIHEHVCQNHIKWSEVTNMVIWSDGGRHFRSNCGIATVACRTMEHLCLHGKVVAGKLPSLEVCFGLASHFKNQADGAQSQLRRCLAEAAKKEVISDCRTMVQRCREVYEETRRPGFESTRMKASFHEYFPAMTKEQFVTQRMFGFAPKSYTEPIGCCQCWSMKLNDVRRRPTPHYLSKHGALTALNFAAQMLPSQRPSGDRTVWPILVPCTFEVEAAEAADGAAEAAAVPVAEIPADGGAAAQDTDEVEILMNQREVRGWLTSYRRNQPEARPYRTWRSKLTKHRLSYQRHGLQPARTRRAMEAQIAVQEKWAAARSARQKVPAALP